MANLKDIKRRISSVKNTQQITKAMKLVAAVKLRKAQDRASISRPYFKIMRDLARRVFSSVSVEDKGSLLYKRSDGNSLVVVVSSDRGLCGSFNSNLFKKTDEIMRESSAVSLIVLGNKGISYYKRRGEQILKSISDYSKDADSKFAEQLAEDLVEIYLNGNYKNLYLVFNRFKNAVVQEAIGLMLLPLSVDNLGSDSVSKDKDFSNYEFEPSEGEVLEGLAKKYISGEIFHSILESAASEHGARMTAMDSASRNAKEMISSLTLEYNRARQAMITKEIIEIVSGADALG